MSYLHHLAKAAATINTATFVTRCMIPLPFKLGGERWEIESDVTSLTKIITYDRFTSRIFMHTIK